MQLSYDITRHEREDSEWVVLIHGFGGNRGMWGRQMNTLRQKYHILNIDLPGHGDSEDVPPQGDLMTATVEAIYTTMRQNGIDKAHFMGVSLGTIFAILMGMMHPEVVIDMVLCGVIIGVNGIGGVLLNIANIVKGFVPYLWLYKLMARVLLPRRKSDFSRRLFIKSAKRLGEQQFRFWMLSMIAAKKNFAISAEHIANMPKLCVMGEHDSLFLRMLLRANREDYGFLIKTIADCGHLCNIEKPKEFNELAVAFFANGAV